MRLHDTCTTDAAAPQFDHEWQRRAFGLALALSEFGHYDWSDFQQNLIETIGRWENAPDGQRGEWQYYDHWVSALQKVVDEHSVLDAPPRGEDH
ncbi:nitrile hydratase accessory protein [Mycobacterium sp. NPDC050551]|uniref:nitrile hydratase accessory protein n=1 Tax=Mycobacterium sp. NPDC050551 TaxID=3155407 RepID=UPI00342C23F2